VIAFFSKGKLETYFFFGGTGFLTSFLTSLPLAGFIGAFAIVNLLIDKFSAFSSKINSILNTIRSKKFRRVFLTAFQLFTFIEIGVL